MVNTVQTLNREQLHQGLEKALASGSIAQQLRFLLTICQNNVSATSQLYYPEKKRTAAQARLETLARLAEHVTSAQLDVMLGEAEQINDAALRLPLIVAYIKHLPHTNQTAALREIWMQVEALNDPVAKARIYFAAAGLLRNAQDDPVIPSALAEVVTLAQDITNTEARIRSLIGLAPHLASQARQRLLQQVFEEVIASDHDALRCTAVTAAAADLPAPLLELALSAAEGIETASERARALTALGRYHADRVGERVHRLILETIAAVRSEEERTDALIGFAPVLEHLGVPSQVALLVAQARSIVQGLTRRPLQARVLVALMPHLPPDGQHEALAVVHGLTNEQERATLLAELAPHLPANMLTASLAVAHTMREQDARVHALTTLAHYVPEYARAQTLSDALAAASNLPHHFERVVALLRLVDILPPELQAQAYTNALETTRLIQNENARARALNLLGPHLPAALLERALDSAQQLTDLQQKMNALLGIAPYLDQQQRQDVLVMLLNNINVVQADFKRARALVTLAPLLPTALVNEALEIALSIEEPFDQVSACIPLVQHLPPAQRPAIIAKIWSRIKQIENGYDRASALAAVAPFLPDNTQTDLAQAAGMLLGLIEEEYDRASAITILAPLLNNGTKQPDALALPGAEAALREGITLALSVPQQMLRVQLLSDGVRSWLALDGDPSVLWAYVVRGMVGLPLADALLCLNALLPLIANIGGETAIGEVAHLLASR